MRIPTFLAITSAIAITGDATAIGSAISAIDSAIDVVNSNRATFGATINRLTYAVDNLTNISQNTTASRSRILDTDYAKATAELAIGKVAHQAHGGAAPGRMTGRGLAAGGQPAGDRDHQQ